MVNLAVMKHIYRNASALFAIVLGGLLSATAGQAATTSDTMSVSANVLSVCVVNAGDMVFGNVDPTSASAVDQTASISVLCTKGTSFTVGLNAGTASGATVTTRRMTGGADQLGYALYRDAARTANWGNTPGTDTPAAQIAASTASALTVYGRIPGGQNVAAGAYTDTITVTVNY